jgi:SAM-dependent methyltransferase
MLLEVAELVPLLGESMASFLEPFAALLLPRKPGAAESRTPERLHAHYRVERRLADRLRAARDATERRAIFATMYDELFREVPDHPRLLARGGSAEERERDIGWDMAQLKPFLKPGCTFLDVGAGDCALSRRVCGIAGQVYAVDISDQSLEPLPPNVALVLTDGQSVDVPAGSVDLAFSDQLMEHLHPEDAREQLRNIHRALKPGGVYFCITPNSLYGPSDISAHFDDVARGFHLKEYTLREIRAIFAEAGFPRTRVYVGARGWFLRCPGVLLEALESALEALPAKARRRVAGHKAFRALLGLRVAATKG